MENSSRPQPPCLEIARALRGGCKLCLRCPYALPGRRYFPPERGRIRALGRSRSVRAIDRPRRLCLCLAQGCGCVSPRRRSCRLGRRDTPLELRVGFNKRVDKIVRPRLGCAPWSRLHGPPHTRTHDAATSERPTSHQHVRIQFKCMQLPCHADTTHRRRRINAAAAAAAAAAGHRHCGYNSVRRPSHVELPSPRDAHTTRRGRAGHTRRGGSTACGQGHLRRWRGAGGQGQTAPAAQQRRAHDPVAPQVDA